MPSRKHLKDVQDCQCSSLHLISYPVKHVSSYIFDKMELGEHGSRIPFASGTSKFMEVLVSPRHPKVPLSPLAITSSNWTPGHRYVPRHQSNLTGDYAEEPCPSSMLAISFSECRNSLLYPKHWRRFQTRARACQSKMGLKKSPQPVEPVFRNFTLKLTSG